MLTILKLTITFIVGVVMIVEKEIKKIFHQLVENDFAQISLAGYDVTIRICESSSKISLSTPVYFGGNFIPKSVRNCISQKTPFQSSLMTSLMIQENKFEIDLNYLGLLNHLNNERFKELLEEFCWLADEWRLFLDEHDKNDLIPVRVK